MPLAPPCGLVRCSCSQRCKGEAWRAGTGAFRRPETFSRGVLRPQGAVSKTNLFDVQNWLQRERRSTDTLQAISVLTRPSSFISKPPRVTPGLHPQDRALSFYPRPVTPTPDQTLQAGPPGGSPPHRPNEETGKAGHADCFTPGQGLSAGASAPGRHLWPSRGKGGPAYSPGALISSSISTLPPPIDLCRSLQVPSLSPGLAGRRGTLESLGCTASLGGQHQGKSGPESERS